MSRSSPRTTIVGLEKAIGASPRRGGRSPGSALCLMASHGASSISFRRRRWPTASSSPARHKTEIELAHAREATRIAELGYQHLLDVARPGMSEDELAAELRWRSKSLGAEDNFVLLCAGPHNKAVAPSNGRRMQAGDTIVCGNSTPSYKGQLAQICRTIVLGEAPTLLRQKYDLVVNSMQAGFAAAKPGAKMSDVVAPSTPCWRPKAMPNSAARRISAAAATALGFLFDRAGRRGARQRYRARTRHAALHDPLNQYLPETGYLLCDLRSLTPQDAQALTRQQAALAEIALWGAQVADMQTMHPALLIGPGDWDARQTPRSEYDERLLRYGAIMGIRQRRVVHGDSRDHAALLYLARISRRSSEPPSR